MDFSGGSQENNLPFSASSAGGIPQEMKLDATSQASLIGFSDATSQLASGIPSLDGFAKL